MDCFIRLLSVERSLLHRSFFTEWKRAWGVYVERASRQWVVLDPDGQFWILPAGADPWPNRQPFELTEDTGLDPVPGHYRYTLGLPL